jgi:hypothetical protein
MRIEMTNHQVYPIDATPDPALNPSSNSGPLSAAPSDSLLLEEIRVLRERGLSDECIHGLFSGFHIDAYPQPSGKQWMLPINDQLIRLIWGAPATRLRWTDYPRQISTTA